MLSKEESHLLGKERSVVLQIEGRVAQFHLTGQHSGVHSGDPSCYKGQHYNCSLAILDEKCQAAGRVVVDSYAVPHLQNRDHKFLGLSATVRASREIGQAIPFQDRLRRARAKSRAF
ncbi:hypothetical protein F4809DRAFT_604711 [Biscogniauxia mediterranea]|nr:hypothetical protein F4809DRAFT_604711 [Biscogniauxia mediterranea]